ncbi:YybH family protein [Ekhidna sp.]|uniref:YybH family protein n=1 Tax=Ekhidna sp. TaxID=2608089 RepID=UPI003B5AB011
MKYSIVLLVAFIACSPSPSAEFPKEDQEAVNQIRKDYVNGWLVNDSETVLNLFHSNANIIPSGMAPIMGIDEIEEYWFPNDSSVTTIHSYEVELLELQGSGSMAFSLEKGDLNFTYKKGDFVMTKTSTSHATTVYSKQKDGSWKIISRMWTQLQ